MFEIKILFKSNFHSRLQRIRKNKMKISVNSEGIINLYENMKELLVKVVQEKTS